MLHLFCAILSSSAVALILKFAESRSYRRMPVIVANYLVAALLSVILAGGALVPGDVSSDPFGALAREASPVFVGGSRFSADGSISWAILWGLPAGLLYFLGLVSIQRSIRESGVGLTGAFSKSAILIPILVSVLLWHERPTASQWGGIILTFVAIALSQSGKGNGSGRAGISLLLMFLAVGSAELSNKVFQQYALPQYKELFLFTLFSVAFVVAAWALFKSRQGPFDKGPEGINRPLVREFLTGLAVGVPNMLSSYLLIQAFASIDASVVFPLYSAGSIALITLGGVALFGERPTRREYGAIAVVLIAIVLMGG